ncbi:MAG TPA: sulfatase/phosphatase domain-containing protein, partial [Candidatus Saccharimonadia bacterium]|nr:sulfatase/phosphatase domain-containing protein [Candidatus Saccharimonadia bacterium]
AIHVDIFPTFLELAKASAPEGHVLDGESLVPLFRDASATLKRDAIYQHFPGYLGAGEDTWRTTPVATIISGDWKLMEFMEDKRVELYNLRDDLGETKNLATADAERTQALLTKLHAWQQDIKAPMPAANTEQGQEGSTGATKKKKGGKGKKAKGQAAAADE